MLVGVGDQPVGDPGVHVVEGVGGFVQVVVCDRAAGRLGHQVCGRVDRRAEMSPSDPFDRGERVGGDVVGACPGPGRRR